MSNETELGPEIHEADVVDPAAEQAEAEHAAAVERDQAQADTGHLNAPDQTAEDRALTDLVGRFQAQAEAAGWTSEVVQWGPAPVGVILGFTAPQGTAYTAAFNLTNPTPTGL